MTIQHIFVVGAGTMGNGIAQIAATANYQVTCMDVMPEALEKARQTIARSTARLLEKGTLTADQKARADSVSYVSDLATVSTAALVIEAATENPELKLKASKDLDAAAPKAAILASNTSSTAITRLAVAP